MIMGVSHIIVIFSVWFLARHTGYASVNSCYYCNYLEKHQDRKHCFDPVDTKHLIKQNCSDVYREFRDFPTDNRTRFICMKMSLKLNGTHMVARECSYEGYRNETNCQFYERYLKSIGRGPVTDVICTTCKDDLCNSAMTAYLSVFALATVAFKILFF